MPINRHCRCLLLFLIGSKFPSFHVFSAVDPRPFPRETKAGKRARNQRAKQLRMSRRFVASIRRDVHGNSNEISSGKVYVISLPISLRIGTNFRHGYWIQLLSDYPAGLLRNFLKDTTASGSFRKMMLWRVADV